MTALIDFMFYLKKKRRTRFYIRHITPFCLHCSLLYIFCRCDQFTDLLNVMKTARYNNKNSDRQCIKVLVRDWRRSPVFMLLAGAEWKYINSTLDSWCGSEGKVNNVDVERNALAWDITCDRAISIPSMNNPSSPVFNSHMWLWTISLKTHRCLDSCQISFSRIGTSPINNLVNMEQSPQSYLSCV